MRLALKHQDHVEDSVRFLQHYNCNNTANGKGFGWRLKVYRRGNEKINKFQMIAIESHDKKNQKLSPLFMPRLMQLMH